jgi:hypothetical protein
MNYATDPYIGPTQRARRRRAARGHRPPPVTNSAATDVWGERPDLAML